MENKTLYINHILEFPFDLSKWHFPLNWVQVLEMNIIFFSFFSFFYGGKPPQNQYNNTL